MRAGSENAQAYESSHNPGLLFFGIGDRIKLNISYHVKKIVPSTILRKLILPRQQKMEDRDLPCPAYAAGGP